MSLGDRMNRKIKISRGEPLTPEEQAAEDAEKAEEEGKQPAPTPTPKPDDKDTFANKVSKGAAAQKGTKLKKEELQPGLWARVMAMFN